MARRKAISVAGGWCGFEIILLMAGLRRLDGQIGIKHEVLPENVQPEHLRNFFFPTPVPVIHVSA